MYWVYIINLTVFFFLETADLQMYDQISNPNYASKKIKLTPPVDRKTTTLVLTLSDMWSGYYSVCSFVSF